MSTKKKVQSKINESSVEPALPKGKYKNTPYYSKSYIFKEVDKNLELREQLRKDAIYDKGLQNALRQAAFEDVLFWFNFFCWCFEPRRKNKILPFVTWPHQDPAIVEMDNAIEYTESNPGESVDVIVDKSRGQGATWIYLMIFLRRWLRDDMFSAGLVARNENQVDSLRDPDTLMWKLVWGFDMLPIWMKPEGYQSSKHRNLSEHSFLNPQNNSTVVGYAATGDVARGGRKTVFAMDELGSKEFVKSGKDYEALNNVQHVTNCRLLVSTFGADSGAYYNEAVSESSDATKIILDWKENPTQNKKLYNFTNGSIFEVSGKLNTRDRKLIYEQHEKLRKRGFKIEDKIRNTWYNSQCLRAGATPRGIARELDRNPKGSVSKVFCGQTIKHVMKEYAKPPIIQGSLIFNQETGLVREPWINTREDGELKLWITPKLDGKISSQNNILGADISAGKGGSFSSNSVASIINRDTGEQIAEWSSSNFPPRKFAVVCHALGKWFNDAVIIPEVNFVGEYLDVLVEQLEYENMYYRKQDIVGLNETTNKVGFWMTNDDKKLALFEAMQEGYATGAFVPRSKIMLQECTEYEWDKDKIVHVSSSKTDGEDVGKKTHADRAIAASLAWHLCKSEVITNKEDIEKEEAPYGSMMYRMNDYFKENPLSDPRNANYGSVDIDEDLLLSYCDDWE